MALCEQDCVLRRKPRYRLCCAKRRLRTGFVLRTKPSSERSSSSRTKNTTLTRCSIMPLCEQDCVLRRKPRYRLCCAKRGLRTGFVLRTKPSSERSSSSRMRKALLFRGVLIMELLPRFELGTSSLPRMCSTN